MYNDQLVVTASSDGTTKLSLINLKTVNQQVLKPIEIELFYLKNNKF